jgi:hypothetical protein
MMSVGRAALKGLRDDGLDHITLLNVGFDGSHSLSECFRREHRCNGQVAPAICRYRVANRRGHAPFHGVQPRQGIIVGRCGIRLPSVKAMATQIIVLRMLSKISSSSQMMKWAMGVSAGNRLGMRSKNATIS